MSGYAVVLRRDGAEVSQAEIARLLVPLGARGPDGAECWREGGIGVASTLLDTGDSRLVPRVTHLADRLWVAGQVRVDDRAAIVRALRDDGHHGSEDDPDVVLFARAWLAWEERALERLLGDFSAVVHDDVTGRTTLVRDSFGVRMLYYNISSSTIIASNTLQAVRAAPGVSSALNDDAIADYIAAGLNEDLATTTFRDVQRVPPAHLLRIERDGRATLSAHWSLPQVAEDRALSDRDRTAQFREALKQSVADRMRTKRLTIFLSGGIDSASLAAVAVSRAGAATGIRARTANMPTIAPNPDELARARLVATSLGIAHDVIDADDFGYREGTSGAQLIDTPEPYDEPDLIFLHAELRAASEWSHVAMWGEDPDSLLAMPSLPDLLRATQVWTLARDVLRHRLTRGFRPHLGIRQSFAAAAKRRLGHQDHEAGPSWLRADLRERRRARQRGRTETKHPTRSAMAARITNPYLQSFLESMDAGRHGYPVDVRHPYFDRRIIDVILRAPAIPWMQRKHLLRESMRGVVPDEVRLAPKRGLPGFVESRLAQWWSRGPASFDPSPALSHFIDVSALEAVGPATDSMKAMLHLRLRILDRWLRART